MVGLGAAVTLGFIVLRTTNLYGDPAPWTAQETWLSTVLSFLDCEKYLPSLHYLMMTLGPAKDHDKLFTELEALNESR